MPAGPHRGRLYGSTLPSLSHDRRDENAHKQHGGRPNPSSSTFSFSLFVASPAFGSSIPCLPVARASSLQNVDDAVSKAINA